MEPMPMMATGAGSFSTQSSKAGRVSSWIQNLLSFPFSDSFFTVDKWARSRFNRFHGTWGMRKRVILVSTEGPIGERIEEV